jgi:hypothetical protein
MAADASPQTFTFVFGKVGSRQTTAIKFPDDAMAKDFAQRKLAELFRDGGWSHVSVSRGDRVYVEHLGEGHCTDGDLTWKERG